MFYEVLVSSRFQIDRLLFYTCLLAPGFAHTGEISYTGSTLNPAGQVRFASNNPLQIPKFTEKTANIRLDGALDEDIWKQVPAYDHLIVSVPDRDKVPQYQTHFYLFYTERGLYVAAWNEQPVDTLLPRLASRDSFRDSDAFQFAIDSSGNGLYGYWFQVKLGDSLSDGIIQPERRFRRNWDGPWRGNSKKVEDGWTVEMFLPWSMMSMPDAPTGKRQMGFSISRELGELHERWSWPALPFTQPKYLSAFQAFELDHVAPRQEFSIFPYASIKRDILLENDDTNAGVDIFWRPSSAFLVSAAVNPDFGQVEADDVVVNLTAFETFFPEKRLFFLENQETFSTITSNSWRGGGATLLHTRRIGSSVRSRRGRPDLRDGLTVDSLDTSRPVDLLFATKGVGQWNRSRFGIMAATEDDTRLTLNDVGDSIYAPGRDFGVLRWLHEDTHLGGRRAVGWLGTVTEHPNRSAITQAVDAHYRSPDSRWIIDGQVVGSDIDDMDTSTKGLGAKVDVYFAPKRGHSHYLRVEGYDNDIDLNDLGYLNRNGFSSAFYDYTWRENNIKGLRERRNSFLVRSDFNPNGKLLRGEISGSRRWSFEDNTRFQIELEYMPEQWDDRNSRGNGIFKLEDRFTTKIRWNTDSAQPVYYELRMEMQSESHGGFKRVLRGDFTYRPIDQMSMRLGTRYETQDSWLLWQGGTSFSTFETEEWYPRLQFDTFFTARQQLQLELNWVGIKAKESQRYALLKDGDFLTQTNPETIIKRDNFAISEVVLQLRYRWQIAPLSDLFVVYNRGGRFPEADPESDFGTLFNNTFADPQNEAFIVKLRYRLGT